MPKRYLSKLVFCVVIIGFCAACSPGKKRKPEVSDKLQEEMEKRALKSFSEAEINHAAMNRGDSIVATLRAKYRSAIKKYIEDKRFEQAVEACNISGYSLHDSIQSLWNAEIKKVAMNPVNPANKPKSIGKQLLEAYEYNQEQNMELRSNIQKLDSSYFLYTEPIILDEKYCLRCHGTQKMRNQQLLKPINELYPESEGHGYNKGDLYGMWHIILSQKRIVQEM